MGYLPKPKSEAEKYVLDEAAAVDQLQLLYDFYDTDLGDASEEQQQKAEAAAKTIAGYIRQGKLEVRGKDGRPWVIQHLKGGQSAGQIVEYKPLDGRAKPKIDAAANPYAMTYTLLGYLCGQGNDVIESMHPADLKVAEAFGNFCFLL